MELVACVNLACVGTATPQAGRQAGMMKLDAIATVVHEGDCTDRLISKCRNCDVYG